MNRASRFTSIGVSARVLGAALLVAMLFVAGCTTNSAPPSPAPAIKSANSSGFAFMMGAAGSFTVVASGTPAPTLTETGTLPNGLTFSAATGTISGTPTGPAGSYTITITAHNGAGPDAAQTFTLTINQPAAITSANSTTFTAIAAGTFTVTATGFPAPTFSESGALPAGVTLASATGILSGTPAAGTGGTYPLTLTAHNGAGADATQSFTLTVNQAAAITSTNTATFTVNAAGTFTVIATGSPSATLSETGALPTGVTFTPATGKLSGTPAAGTAGTYPLTLTAHNGIGADATQIFSLVVNQAPAITSANSTSFTVGVAGTFTAAATGSPAPTFSESGSLPSGVTFNNSTGVLAGTPAAGMGGSYPIVITALNGVGANATQNFTLTVNQSSAITSANATTLIVNAAGTFTVTATGFPAPTLSESGALPSGVTFTPGTGKLSGTPGAGTSGSYPITFTAHNGIGADATQVFTLTIDQSSSITSSSSTTFAAGSLGTFTVTATGVPAPALSESGALPNGVTFNTSTGVLGGTAAPGTGGIYNISFTAHNGVGADAVQSFTLTVNQAPLITSANNTAFVVGTLGSFTVTSVGPPAPSLSETGALPSGVTFNTGTGVLSGTPGPGTSGSYPISFTAHNIVSPDAIQAFTLTVNQSPAITSVNNTTFTAGTAGTFTVTASGAPAPTFTESGSLPAGVLFNNSTGVLAGTPGAGTGGVYSITFTALNGIGANATQSFTLTVDQAPLITSANSKSFTVNAFGTFTVTASGPPSPSLVESGALPTGVTFTDNGNGTGTLSGTATAQGSFPISFTAHNGIGTDAVQSFTLTVNQAPVITSVTTTTFTVGSAGTFTVTAGGVPAPTLSESGALPGGVTFNTSTGVLSGTPGAGTGNTYPVTFTAHNSSGPDAVQSFTLIVDQAPAITSATNTTFTIGALGNFTVTATGFPAPTYSETGALPSGVSLNSSTGVLGGTPAGGTAGNYPITLTAHNGVGADATQPFTLTVNQAPVITSGTTTTFTVGSLGTFTVTATGSPVPSLSETGSLPSGVTFNTGTGVLSGTPAVGTGGTYPINFRAHNGAGADSVQSFSLVVDEGAVITSANSTSFVLNSSGTFTVTATGFPTPTLSESGTLPTGVTFNTSTGVLGGTPTSSGSFPITFTAHNGVGADGTQSFTLTTAAPTCTTNCTISGTISGPWVPGVTLSRSGSVTTVLTDAGGHYSFTGLAGGTYTITPVLAGYTFSPSAPAVTISANTTTQDFVETPVMASFSISGTITYSGTANGVTLIRVLPSGCTNGCNSVAGTSIATKPSSTGTAYTIRGLQPVGGGGNSNGSYVVTAEIDTLGTGQPNAADPTGSTSTITITSADVINANFIINDRTPPAPVTPTQFNVSPGNQMALAQYKGPRDVNGEEIATSYKILMGTDVNASNGATVTFNAQGTHDDIYIIHGLTNGTYYFKMIAHNANGDSAPSSIVGPITVGPTSGANTVSGTVTFPGTATGPLYVGVYDGNTGKIYEQTIASPVSPQAYSVAGVPNGNTYQGFAIIDMNNDGVIGPGDIENVNHSNGPPPVTVSGNTTNNIVLSGAPMSVSVATNHQFFSGDSYNLDLRTSWGTKRPVSVTLFSGPNVPVPLDMGADSNNDEQTPTFPGSTVPVVGDTYQFQVKYSDGTTGVITSQVTAVLTSFAQSLAMNTAGSRTTPVLTWAAPASPPASYTYNVGLSNSNGLQENWFYSGGNNSNGIPSTQTSVLFDVDGSANPSSSLTTGTTYQWWVTVQDSNGNSAQIGATYIP